jgi:peptide/nickel transport system permease protein
MNRETDNHISSSVEGEAAPSTGNFDTLPVKGDDNAGRTQSLWALAWKRLKRNRLAMVGMYTIGFMIFVAIFANFLAPHSPNRQIVDYANKEAGFTGDVLVKTSSGGYDEDYIPVQWYEQRGNEVTYVDSFGDTLSVPVSELVGSDESSWHWQPLFILGTDRYGRDILSRLIFGTRISISVGFLAEMIALFIGVFLGAIAGYFRGAVDTGVMYLANVVWSFPYILLVIALSLVIGVGFVPTFVAIGVASWVDMCRIVRGQFFAIRETEYVEATRALGFGAPRTIFRHILPNILGPITVIATAGFAMAIIAEASLAFIGIGIQKPEPSWGSMIYEGRLYLASGENIGQMVYPCICLACAVFGFNLFGDGLRDALDPKLQK